MSEPYGTPQAPAMRASTIRTPFPQQNPPPYGHPKLKHSINGNSHNVTLNVSSETCGADYLQNIGRIYYHAHKKARKLDRSRHYLQFTPVLNGELAKGVHYCFLEADNFPAQWVGTLDFIKSHLPLASEFEVEIGEDDDDD